MLPEGGPGHLPQHQLDVPGRNEPVAVNIVNLKHKRQLVMPDGERRGPQGAGSGECLACRGEGSRKGGKKAGMRSSLGPSLEPPPLVGLHLVALRLKAERSRTNSLKFTLSNAWTTALASGLTLSSGMLSSSSDARKP